MSVTGLDLIFLEVNSIEESLAFYQGVLGFAVTKHTPESEPPMATVQAGALRITFAQHLETMLKRGRGVSLFLGVSDVEEYFRELSERGAELRAPLDEGWGGRFISVQDPDRYRLFFVQWNE